MKFNAIFIGATFAIVAGFGAHSVFAQQAPAKRDFDAEIRATLQSAKDEAEFEHLGTLARICLLPQSGGEDNCVLELRLPSSLSSPRKLPLGPAPISDL
jgi:hypothetical protein